MSISTIQKINAIMAQAESARADGMKTLARELTAYAKRLGADQIARA